MEQCNAGVMYACERCGKNLIDVADLLLLMIGAVNLVFGIIILSMGSWFGISSFFLVVLFWAGFAIRRRECKHCHAVMVRSAEKK
jgi:hypothetical protein